MTKRYVGLFLVCAWGCADSVTDIPQVVAESPQVETAEAINTLPLCKRVRTTVSSQSPFKVVLNHRSPSVSYRK